MGYHRSRTVDAGQAIKEGASGCGCCTRAFARRQAAACLKDAMAASSDWRSSQRLRKKAPLMLKAKWVNAWVSHTAAAMVLQHKQADIYPATTKMVETVSKSARLDRARVHWNSEWRFCATCLKLMLAKAQVGIFPCCIQLVKSKGKKSS